MGLNQIFCGFFVFVYLSAMTVFGEKFQLIFLSLIFLYFICNFGRVKLKFILVFCLFFLMFLLILSAFMASKNFSDFNFLPIRYIIQPIVEGAVFSFFIFNYFKIKSEDNVYDLIFVYIIIQFVFFIVMLFFPDIRSSILIDAYGSTIENPNDAFSRAMIFRGFGFTKQHLFAFPILVATMVATYAVSSNSFLKKTVVSFFGFALILLNARIALVGLSIFIMSYFIFSFKNMSKGLLITVLLIVLCILYFNSTYYDYSNVYVKWLVSGMLQFTSNSDSQTTLTDLNSMLHLPSNILFGNGQVCSNGTECYSDIGFIRLLQLSGIISLSIFMLLIVFALNEYTRFFFYYNKKIYIFFFSSILLAYIIYMIKGEAYSLSDFSRYIYMIAFLNIYVKGYKTNARFK